MKFTYDNLTINAYFKLDLKLEGDAPTGMTAWYNKEKNHIVIDVEESYKCYTNDYVFGLKYIQKEIKLDIIHELTHYFDYNFWKSWLNKEHNTTEHLSTFNELFHERIEGFKNQILTIALKKLDHIVEANKKVGKEETK